MERLSSWPQLSTGTSGRGSTPTCTAGRRALAAVRPGQAPTASSPSSRTRACACPGVRVGLEHRPGLRRAPSAGDGRRGLRSPGGLGRRPAGRGRRHARHPGTRGDDRRIRPAADANPDRILLAARRSGNRRCASPGRPGAGGPIDVWIASPPDAGIGTPADRHRHPRRASRSLDGGTEPGGRPARVARLPRPAAEHPRLGVVRPGLDPAPARRLGRRRCRRRPRRPRPCARDRADRSRPGSA